MTSQPSLPAGVTEVTESRSGPLDALVHPAWASLPWVVQGSTTRRGSRDFDLGLFSSGNREEVVRANWAELATGARCRTVVHARQVHGADVHVVDGSLGPGRGRGGPAVVPDLLEPADGHVTDRADVLLAVTTADCVPVFLLDARARSVGAVHAGWRGVAAGILERTVDVMAAAYGTSVADLQLHLGPAICGSCYEVGPEVFEALGEPAPDAPTPIDVRAALARRAVRLGVAPEDVTVSSHCTRCTGSDLYSHRGGDVQRQVGFIGIREDGP